MISPLKHNVSQWYNYWDGTLTNYVCANLNHNILHDLAIYFRASPLKTEQLSVKVSDDDNVHKVTPDPVIKNPITSEASPFKTKQSSFKEYDADTFHKVTPYPVINHPMTSDEILHKIFTCKETQIQITNPPISNTFISMDKNINVKSDFHYISMSDVSSDCRFTINNKLVPFFMSL